jgi:hypothetical protein
VLQLPAHPVAPIVRRPSIAPFVLGGVGLAFAAAFGGFGVAGIIDRTSSGCDKGCSSPDYNRVRAELVTADVSLGLAALFIVAAVIDFAATRTSSKRTAFVPLTFAF